MDGVDAISGTPPARRFELSGGVLCLDFANTWGDRQRPESDRLRSHGDLVAFAREAAVLPAAQLDAIARAAGADAAAAAAAWQGARELREALYRLFSAHARGRAPDADDLERVNGALHDALPHLCLARRGDAYGWRWDEADVALAAPLRPIVHSAAELLAGDDLRRVRECDGSTCTWLFLDRSRNRSRRWCDMESCGNRAKAARHYHRRRQDGG
jgi:predicted RNA-binding Zn ribbon-like protein